MGLSAYRRQTAQRRVESERKTAKNAKGTSHAVATKENEPAPAKPATAPRSPAPDTASGTKPAQNTPNSGIGRGLPNPGGRRSGGITATGPTKTTDAEDRKDRRHLRDILFGHLAALDKADRDERMQRERFAHEERMRKGLQVYKFKATMSGSGFSNLRVKFREIKPPSFSQTTSTSTPGSRPPGAPSRLEAAIAKMLGEGKTPDETFNAPKTPNIPGNRKPERQNLPWLPTDTVGKGKAYSATDFLGAMNKDRSDRFQGGYMAPEFRERFIEDRMGGLRPGDNGYSARYDQVNAAWQSALSQYDQRFKDYGDSILRDQTQAQTPAAGTPPGSVGDAAAQAIKASTDAKNAAFADSVSHGTNASTMIDNNGSQTVFPQSGRIVFAQPDQQGQAVLDADKHKLRRLT